jgi:AcrR family transcriptional regulator
MTESVSSDPAPDTKARLLDGALAVLATRGLAGTTSREIAAASGVNLAGITYHFGSKDRLIMEALMTTIRRWLAPALEVLKQNTDPVSRMVGAVDALQTSFDRARDLLPLYVEALAQAAREPRLRRAVTELYAELRTFLTTQIRELRSTGFLPQWVDPEQMALLLVASADGLALHAAVEPAAVDHRAVAPQVIQMLLSARAAEETKET